MLETLESSNIAILKNKREREREMCMMSHICIVLWVCKATLFIGSPHLASNVNSIYSSRETILYNRLTIDSNSDFFTIVGLAWNP